MARSGKNPSLEQKAGRLQGSNGGNVPQSAGNTLKSKLREGLTRGPL